MSFKNYRKSKRIKGREKAFSYLLISNEYDYEDLSQFKSYPTIFPETYKVRPFMGFCCTKCVPDSQTTFNEDSLSTTLGMANMLKVPTENRDRGFFARAFYYASFVMSRTTDSHFNDVSKKVMRSETVQEAIRRSAREEMKEYVQCDPSADKSKVAYLELKHRSRAVKILQDMRSCISSSLLRIAGWVLYKILGRMFSTIQIHKGQLEMLKRAIEHKVPIIYLPMHRSHLDYILLSFILYMNDIKPPLVAAGDNLMIPFFGNLMRGLGAFFIKRKLDPQEGKRDHVYRAVLQTYMAENLKEGNSLEFFLEGGRSRSGKACIPKAGLLSVVVNAVLEGAIEDVYIVPVGISYEKLIDGNFVSEQLGQPKILESFSIAAKAIWSRLHESFGNVRVDFCQPFSLKDYLRGTALNSSNSKMSIQNGSLDYSPFYCSACSPRFSDGKRSSSVTSLYAVDYVVSEDKRQTIKELSQHIVFDAFNSTALMSTQVLAFLLLVKFRKGATSPQLIQSITWLREELTKRKRDVGFTGESSNVLRYACNMLGKNLLSTITLQWSQSAEAENNNVKLLYLKPVVKIPQVLELQYYSNTLTSVFLLDSVIANAIYAVLGDEIENLVGIDGSDVTFSREKLLNAAQELCNLFQHEFIFVPPCTVLSNAINDVIENFITYGLLAEANDNKSGSKYHRFAVELEDFDEDCDGYFGGQVTSQDLRVVLGDENIETMNFYRNILCPFIESYWLASCALVPLIGKSRREKLFFEDLLATARERLSEGLLCFEESVAADTLKNAMKTFETWRVLDVKTTDSVKTYQLSQEFNSKECVNDLMLKIEKFKK